MEYRDLELRLLKYTDNWNMSEGSFPLESKSDLENAEVILSKRYSKVDKHHLDMNNREIDGTDYRIEFSEPFLEEERKRRELTFLPELDPEIAKEGPIGSGLGQTGLAEDLDDSSVFRMFVEELSDNTPTEEEQSPDVIEDVHDEVVIDELPVLEEVDDDSFGLGYLLEDASVSYTNAKRFAKFLEETSEDFEDGIEINRSGNGYSDFYSILITGYAGDGRESEFETRFLDDGTVETYVNFYTNDDGDVSDDHMFKSYNDFMRWVNREGGNLLFGASDLANNYYDTDVDNYDSFKSKMDALHDLDLEESIEKHDELNPDLFENNELKSEVKEKIEEIVQHFKDNLKEDEIELDIKDILLVGSNASFNYTKDSDIDVHIVADTSIYEDKADLAAKVYEAYKRLFNQKYDPTIRGHEVEIYVDPNENHAKSNGIYSLNTGWVKEPENNDIPEVNQEEVDKAVAPFEERANNVKTLDEIDKLIDDIYIVRQQGILEDGEYSLGNLTFKEFRNKGYLERLKDMKIELENKEMSLESLQEDTDDKKAEFLSYCEGKTFEDLGTVGDYEVVMIGDIKEFNNVKIVIDEDDEESLVGYVKRKRVIESPMISPVEYALRMEFTKITEDYKDMIIEYWEDFSYLLEEGKVSDFAKKAVKKLDNAAFDKETKTQVNFADYEKEISEIMDQYDDVIDAAAAAIEFLVLDVKDPYAIKLMSTSKGADNLYAYMEKIAEYEGVGKRQHNAEMASFKDDIKDFFFEPEEESLEEDIEDGDSALSALLADNIGEEVHAEDGIFVTESGAEYIILTEEEAYNKAIEEIKSVYDDLGLEAFSAQFVKDFSDNYEFFNEEVVNDAIEAEIEYVEDDSPEVADNLRNASFEEKVDYLLGLYGEDLLEDFYDIDKIAEAVVEMDGVANSLAHYDGEEIYLGNDLYAYRVG